MFGFFKNKKSKSVKNIVVIVDENFYPSAENPNLEDIKKEWRGEIIYNVTNSAKFEENKSKYYRFYNDVRNHYRRLKYSSRYHKELLDIFKGHNLKIINLGIDHCFEKLGFENVIHPKGINTHLLCNPANFGCGERFRFKEFNRRTVCPNCGEKEHLRPNMDWFGEASDSVEWDKAKNACENADLIVFIGSDCRRVVVQTLINVNFDCKKVEIAPSSSDVLETEFHYVIIASDNIIGLKKLKSLLPIYLKG